MSKWIVSADKLDSEQRYFVLHKLKEKNNYWIYGFAGSGKSVLLMHALSHIRATEPNAKILMVHFTYALKEMYIQALKELRLAQPQFITSVRLSKDGLNQDYDYILCDEVQDITATALQIMRKHCRYLYVAGDVNQSIYDCDPFSQEKVVDVNQIGSIANAKPYELNTIHRLTKSLVGLITAFMPQLTILSNSFNNKQDVTPRLVKFDHISREITYVMEKAFASLAIGETVAILLPSHGDIGDFVREYARLQGCDPSLIEVDPKDSKGRKLNYTHFNNTNHLKLHYIGNGYGLLSQSYKKVIIMTYHSAKGLDFDSVFLPALNDRADFRKESLFMVGLSRAKNTLTLSYTGKEHPFLQRISDKCHDITAVINKGNEVDQQELYF